MTPRIIFSPAKEFNVWSLYYFFFGTEKYTRGVSAVESILTLDRLRQSVAVKELLQAQGQPLMRKTASVPNISQVIISLSTFKSVISKLQFKESKIEIKIEF